MKKYISTVILIVILAAGLSLLLYPTVSDYWNSFHQSQAIAGYSEQVSELDEKEYAAILEEAHEYNESLWSKPNHFFPSAEELEEYESMLNISGTGMMGYVEVPVIECRLPVYHGADEVVLQNAVGHIPGSSLPVGGESTHSILSAHRGLPSAKLFTNLDQVREGDIFLLHVLDEKLTYQVDQIKVVLPEETEDLELVKGKDYCTLVTCTPYGVNTHRLLVRGHRIENLAEGATAAADAAKVEPLTLTPFFVVLILIVLMLWRLLRRCFT